MTFGELAELIAIRLRPDGDSKISVPENPSSWIATPFGKEIQRLLKAYTIDTYSIYTSTSPVTLLEDDIEVDLLNSQVCPQLVWLPNEMWIGGSKLRMSDSEMSLTPQGGQYAQSTPTRFAVSGHGTIKFDSKCPAGLSDCFVSGYSEHPKILLDSQSVKNMGPNDQDLFSAYAEVMMRESVASDGVGIERLRRVDQSRYQAIISIRAKNLKRVLGDQIR